MNSRFAPNGRFRPIAVIQAGPAPGLLKQFAAEYDPQPFHLSDEGANGSIFGSLAASGWHTAALTMRLLVESIPLADGLVGAELLLKWPKPTRPGMTLQVFAEVVEIIPSRSKPHMAIVTMRNETRDQDGEAVQIVTVKLPVFRARGRNRVAG